MASRRSGKKLRVRSKSPFVRKGAKNRTRKQLKARKYRAETHITSNKLCVLTRGVPAGLFCLLWPGRNRVFVCVALVWRCRSPFRFGVRQVASTSHTACVRPLWARRECVFVVPIVLGVGYDVKQKVVVLCVNCEGHFRPNTLYFAT